MPNARPVLAVLTVLGASTALAACGSSAKTAASGPTPGVLVSRSAGAAPSASGSATAATTTAAPTGAAPTGATPAALTLPDGTTTILPGHRVVAYYGTPTTPPDNALPEAGTPDQAAKAVEAKAKPFATTGDPVLPAFELIATVIQGDPGPEGDHAADIDLSTIQKYEDSAVKNHLLLILDIQPGTGHYLPHVQRLAKFLAMPNVGIALDPEWQFLTGGYQNKTGSSPASEINTVSAYLSQYVETRHLPQKLFVLHQFTTQMITDRKDVKNEPGLATVMHIDGIGSSAAGGIASKIADYKVLHGGPGQFSGFKLFFHEDTRLMSPAEVLALKPAPDLVTYQ